MQVCFICLAPSSSDAPLLRPCACPTMHSHAACLSRWQLRSEAAGSTEATSCRFCSQPLADWRHGLPRGRGGERAPQSVYERAPAAAAARRQPHAPRRMQRRICSLDITYNGRTATIEAVQGDYELFERRVRNALNIPARMSIDLNFERIPDPFDDASATTFSMKGNEYFNTALDCILSTTSDNRDA